MGQGDQPFLVIAHLQKLNWRLLSMSSLSAELKLSPPLGETREQGLPSFLGEGDRKQASTKHLSLRLGTGSQASLLAFHSNGAGRGPRVGTGLCPTLVFDFPG